MSSRSDRQLLGVDTLGELGETEAEVIDTLAGRQNDILAHDTASLAELSDATDIEESRLSESVERLDGSFLIQSDGEYRIGYAGKKLWEALVGVSQTREPETTVGDTDYGCPVCERSLEVEYSDDTVTYRCSEHSIVDVPVPPAAAAKSDLDRLDTLVNILPRQRLELAKEGYCWNCWGHVACEYPIEPPAARESVGPTPELARFSCTDCDTEFGVMLSQCLSTEPEVVSLSHEHGVDITDVPFVAVDDVLELSDVSESDGTKTVEVEFDDERVTLRLDDQTQVTSIER
jgi:hypothetical protein